MVHQVSPICNFLFWSLRTTLPTDMEDAVLTVQMAKGIYTYRKYQTAESMTFIPCSKKVTPFPSLRCKIQAYKDEQGNEKVLQWTISFQFPTFPVTQTTQTDPRKTTSSKIRAKWSFQARYNPTKTKRPYTLDLPITNKDMTDSNKVVVPLSVKVSNRFGPMCQFCKQSTQHPSPKNQTGWMEIGMGKRQKQRN